MHNFSLTEYIASDEEGAVTNYMTEIKLCQKSFDEDNIGCYYCLLRPGSLLGIVIEGYFALCLVFFKRNI